MLIKIPILGVLVHIDRQCFIYNLKSEIYI